MSADTVVDIYEKPGVPYSTSADVYSTSSIGVTTPPVETAAVVNPGMGGGGPAPLPATPPLTFNTGSPIADQTPTIGAPFTQDISTKFLNGGSSRAYSVFSGSLPPGLTLNGTTGVVAGTPTTLGGPNAVVFRAVDNAGNSANSNAVNYTVAAAATMVLLLHMDGTVGSSTLLDSSGRNHPITLAAPVGTYSAGAAVYGPTGWQAAGSSPPSNFETDESTDFGFTGDCTVEWEHKGINSLAFDDRCIFDSTKAGAVVGFRVRTIYDGSGEPQIRLVNSAGAVIATSGQVSRSVPVHVRVCKKTVASVTTLYLFVNGVLIGSGVDAGVYPASTILHWCSLYGNTNGNAVNFDEVRVIKGSAESTTNFTRPSAAWPNTYP